MLGARTVERRSADNELVQDGADAPQVSLRVVLVELQIDASPTSEVQHWLRRSIASSTDCKSGSCRSTGAAPWQLTRASCAWRSCPTVQQIKEQCHMQDQVSADRSPRNQAAPAGSRAPCTGESRRGSRRGPCGCRARAKPKSPILRTPPAPGLLSSRFCGFRSLYDTRAKRTDQQGGLHDIRAMPKCIRYLSSLAIRSDTTASSSVIACNRTIGPHAASAATSAIDGEAVAASKPRHAES